MYARDLSRSLWPSLFCAGIYFLVGCLSPVFWRIYFWVHISNDRNIYLIAGESSVPSKNLQLPGRHPPLPQASPSLGAGAAPQAWAGGCVAALYLAVRKTSWKHYPGGQTHGPLTLSVKDSILRLGTEAQEHDCPLRHAQRWPQMTSFWMFAVLMILFKEKHLCHKYMQLQP